MKSLIENQKSKIKNCIVLAIFFCGSLVLNGQDITGQWNGVLSIQGVNLRLAFHINKTDGGYASTMDSPDQNAFGIPVASTAFDGSKLTLAVPNIGLSYEGEFRGDSITGTFRQGVLSVPMTLKRTPEEAKPAALHRPQEPQPPFPYRMEDVVFENAAAGVTLAGTLTMPATGRNFTAVILISGSGQQDRNSEIMGHKPFLVIADYLTRRGIAVLRFDDRGAGQSTGNPATATTADFATDVESAIAYLKTRREVNRRKIGLIGHSEGGVIAQMLAASSKDVAFIVMLAGTGIRGAELLLQQATLVHRVAGMPEDRIAKTVGINTKVFDKILNTEGLVSAQEISDFLTGMKDDIAAITPSGMTADDYIKLATAQFSIPWMQYFLRYDPAPTLEKVKCPVLAVNGDKDLQVPARENLTAISEALKRGSNRQVTIKEYPGLNHLFQECNTGSPANYATIEQTFSPEVLKDVGEWVMKR